MAHRRVGDRALGVISLAQLMVLLDATIVNIEQLQLPGDAVFVKAGEWHGFRNDSDQPVTVVVICRGVGSFAEVEVA